MYRTWTGRVRAGAETEHDAFVAWLDSAEGRRMLQRTLLNSYSLTERDGRLTVTLGVEEPPSVVRFLRDRRFWPDFWEFESADPARAVGQGALERVAWRRDQS